MIQSTRLICCVVALVAIAAAPAHRWQDYGNVRFAYHACYPADLMTAGPEADNGDGRTFTARDGAELRVFGWNNATDTNLAALARRDAREMDRGRASYVAVRPGWSVVSGRKGGNILYIKRLAANDAFVELRLRYPARVAARWNGLTAPLGKCLKLLGR